MKPTRHVREEDLGEKKTTPNNLLDFMLQIGQRTKNLILGTATPIQTEVYELWNLMRILNSGAEFVLGRETVSCWTDWQRAIPVIKGEVIPSDEREAWEWLRNPLPPGDEDPSFALIRNGLGLSGKRYFTDRAFGSLQILRAAGGFATRWHLPSIRSITRFSVTLF